MIKKDKYKTYLSNWISKFKSKLNYTKYECIPFYILNKEFFDFPQKRGNINRYILIDNNDGKYMINPDKIFFILDEETWSKIKYDYPNEIELKIKATFINKKCLFQINDKIYYFYYINNNKIGNIIEEGYFKFDNHQYADFIIGKFLDLEINIFFNEMRIKETNEIQRIYYQKQFFSFKIKENGNQNKNNNDNFFDKDNKKEIQNRKNEKIHNNLNNNLF